MEMQEIEVIIEPDGSVRIEVRGVQGLSCLDLTRDMEAALGGQVEAREMRPEAYDQPEQNPEERQQRAGQG